MGIGTFLQDQVLGMKWLNAAIGRGLEALGLDLSSRLGASVQFFLYDVLKITILLCVLIFCISYIQSYFPPERSRKILGRFHGIGANLIAALLGTVTPFCSCSSIPVAEALLAKGAQLGTVLSFMMAVTTLSLPSLVLLRKAVKPRLLALFVGVCAVGIVTAGYLFNALSILFI